MKQYQLFELLPAQLIIFSILCCHLSTNIIHKPLQLKSKRDMSTEGEEVALPVVVDDKKSEAENAKKLGNDAFANKKFDEAIVLYNQAIQLDPDNAVFYSNRR